jgi:hypothetical protein
MPMDALRCSACELPASICSSRNKDTNVPPRYSSLLPVANDATCRAQRKRVRSMRPAPSLEAVAARCQAAGSLNHPAV